MMLIRLAHHFPVRVRRVDRAPALALAQLRLLQGALFSRHFCITSVAIETAVHHMQCSSMIRDRIAGITQAVYQ
jgi:hypothetical protein